nr:hypothetical protein [Cressdnaviricota sp.]UOF81555.1 hypothetical protein [Cressdnaviricota sp.]
MIYAVTITPSPHKKYLDKAYKHYSHRDQEWMLKDFLIYYSDLIYESAFELTQTDNIHMHLTMFMTEEQKKEFQAHFIHEFGYSGKHNNPSDFILMKPIPDTDENFERWQDYLNKERINIPLFSTK